MALLTKPNIQQVWASGGDIVEPSDLKKQQGWTVEVPPHQFENWIQNRQDEYLAHINQRGIPQWDGNTEYEAGGLSYVQGSNGVVYKSVAASGPLTTVQDPTTDVNDTYWTVAWAEKNNAVLTGNPTAPTPAQFDNDTNLATTEFVQRSLGSLRGALALVSNTTLTAADLGKVISLTGGITVALPLGSTIAPGAAYAFMNGGVSDATVSCNAANAIGINSGTVNSITLGSGDFLYLAWTGGLWRITSGTSAMKYSASFSASLTTSGYQKLPSGVIIQWGQVATDANGNVTLSFPLTFPTAARQVLISPSGVNGNIVATWSALTSSAVTVKTRNNGDTINVSTAVSFLVIGN